MHPRTDFDFSYHRTLLLLYTLWSLGRWVAGYRDFRRDCKPVKKHPCVFTEPMIYSYGSYDWKVTFLDCPHGTMLRENFIRLGKFLERTKFQSRAVDLVNPFNLAIRAQRSRLRAGKTKKEEGQSAPIGWLKGTIRRRKSLVAHLKCSQRGGGGGGTLTQKRVQAGRQASRYVSPAV